MVIGCKLEKQNKPLEIDLSQCSREMYKTVVHEGAQAEAYDIFSMIKDFRQAVSLYRKEFNDNFNEFIKENSLLEQMKNSLNPDGSRSAVIGIKNSDVQNSLNSTIKFANTMQQGHSLLLKMREILTGQKIKTKFIVNWNGKMYEVAEDIITPELILDADYNGNTVSNPFSLAYGLSEDNEKLMEELRRQEKEQKSINDQLIKGQNLYEKIWSSKEEYLAELSKERNGKKYRPYWNSKDAEIYELLKQEIEFGHFTDFSTERYISLRKQMGGGGGYATPFYKAGDISDTQIKFVTLKTKGKMTTVNFARFSLLRDRFKELEEMLKKESINDIISDLEKFFTEKDEHLDEITQIFNNNAKEEFSKWLI